MRVKMLEEKRLKVSALQTKICPVDSTPILDDETALQWIEEGAAEPVEDAVELTAGETRILKSLAQVAESTSEQVTVDWDQLTDDDLREIAQALDVKHNGRTSRVTLLERLIERHDDVVALLTAAGELQ